MILNLLKGKKPKNKNKHSLRETIDAYIWWFSKEGKFYRVHYGINFWAKPSTKGKMYLHMLNRYIGRKTSWHKDDPEVIESIGVSYIHFKKPFVIRDSALERDRVERWVREKQENQPIEC